MTTERELSSIVLGSVFLGLLMLSMGLSAEGEHQPIPVRVWRGIGMAGGVLAVSSLPAARVRREWARKAAASGLFLCGAALSLLLAISILQGRWNPFTLLLAAGVAGCGKGMMFYSSLKVRELFRAPSVPT